MWCIPVNTVGVGEICLLTPYYSVKMPSSFSILLFLPVCIFMSNFFLYYMPSSATQKPPEPHTYNEELRLAVEQNANMSSNKCCAPVRCSSTITPQCKKFNTLISKHICSGVELWQLSCIVVLILSEGFKKTLDLSH